MKPRNSDNLFDGLYAQEPDKTAVGRVVRVAFNSGADSLFDYIFPDSLGSISVGQRIEVPLGKNNKPTEAFCVEIPQDPETTGKNRRFRLKTVRRVIDPVALLDEGMIKLAQWISEYYVCPLGQVLWAMVPAAVKKGAGVKNTVFIYLAGAGDDICGRCGSLKQKAIADVLAGAGAVDAESAMEKGSLLAQVGCTEIPLKSLIRHNIVRAVGRSVKKTLPVIPEQFVIQSQQVVLNQQQQIALDKITAAMDTGRFGVTLLHGVTDSGKTELYIQAIEQVIKKGRSAIVMLPEIALTAQTVARFSSRFGRIAVMHSGLSAGQRNQEWQKIKNGGADVVIGARSAVFAPLSNIGLIVVDEEHEPGYKQDTVPRYHGRDVAIKRAQLAAAHCLLGSATPSLETLHNCRMKKHYQLLRLTKRVMDLPMPEMRLVDMSEAVNRDGRKTPVLLSPQLVAALSEVLLRKEQAILLLNRRGYSSFIFCPSCRYALRCRNCDAALTFHRKDHGFDRKPTVLGAHIAGGYALCHYCLAKTLVPENCPLCRNRMVMTGPGAQRLVEELMERFPAAVIWRVDSDAMAFNPENYYRLLKDFADGRIDILAGTQILAKGLHFPNVTLVGIISADTSLVIPDFRANERTFQLICQVAGRAGRAEKKGIVIVQTFLPEQPAIKLAMKNDYDRFVEGELSQREKCSLPPYWRMAIVLMRHHNFERLSAIARQMREAIDGIISTGGFDVKVRGPMPSVVSRIQGRHRMQIVLQAADAQALSGLFGQLRSQALGKATTVAIDVDPVNVL